MFKRLIEWLKYEFHEHDWKQVHYYATSSYHIHDYKCTKCPETKNRVRSKTERELLIELIAVSKRK